MQTLEELGYADLDYYQIVFPHLGIDLTINPTAFTIFGLNIQWYGLIITFGLLLALVFGIKNMPRFGINPDRAMDAIIGGIIGGILGARIYYVTMNWKNYAGDWKSILNIREGGLAIYGGIIGAFLIGMLICKLRKVPILPMFDLSGMGFLIGQGIGRWGNFTNQEAFGCNTDSLFGMSGGRIQYWIASNAEDITVKAGTVLDADYPVHPCFLYESVWCLLGVALLSIVMVKFRKFDGQLFLMYIFWYGLERSVVEGLRTDSLMIGTLRVSQVLAIVCVIVSFILLMIGFARVKRLGNEYVLYCNSAAYRKQLEEDAAMQQRAEERRQQRKQQTQSAAKAAPSTEAAEVEETKDHKEEE